MVYRSRLPGDPLIHRWRNRLFVFAVGMVAGIYACEKERERLGAGDEG